MAVAGVPDTRQGRNADVVNQRIGRDRATGLAMTGGGETGLRQCRRIIALQPDPLAGQNHRVRVKHKGPPAARAAPLPKLKYPRAIKNCVYNTGEVRLS